MPGAADEPAGGRKATAWGGVSIMAYYQTNDLFEDDLGDSLISKGLAWGLAIAAGVFIIGRIQELRDRVAFLSIRNRQILDEYSELCARYMTR
jgi:hypothetical protein